MNAQKLLLAKFKDSLIRFTKKEISYLAVRVADVIESKKKFGMEAMIAKIEAKAKEKAEADCALHHAWMAADEIVAKEKEEIAAKAKAKAKAWFSRG